MKEYKLVSAPESAGEFALKTIPPAGIGGITFLGCSLPEWVIILTLIYTALNVVVLLKDKFVLPAWRAYRERRK